MDGIFQFGFEARYVYNSRFTMPSTLLSSLPHSSSPNLRHSLSISFSAYLMNGQFLGFDDGHLLTPLEQYGLQHPLHL